MMATNHLWMCILALLSTGSLQAQSKFGTSIAIEGWQQPKSAQEHGIVVVNYQTKSKNAAHHQIVFNTDTILLRSDHYRLNNQWTMGAFVKGEYALTKLMWDYYRLGERIEERGFSWHDVSAEVFFKKAIAGAHYGEIAIATSRWTFEGLRNKTATDFILPANIYVLQPRLRYTFWQLENDHAWNEHWRFFPRLKGLGFGGQLGLDIRSKATPWGTNSGMRANTPQKVTQLAYAWVRGGQTLGKTPFRYQGQLHIHFDNGGDDLSHAVSGGLNPYVLPVAGTPWGAYRSDRIVAASTTFLWTFSTTSEVGLQSDFQTIRDINREGSHALEGAFGFAMLADIRRGPWQIDARIGFAPKQISHPTMSHIGVFVGLGYQVL